MNISISSWCKSQALARLMSFLVLGTFFSSLSAAYVNVQSFDQSQSFGYESLEDIHLTDSRIPDFKEYILTAGFSYNDRPLVLENSSSTARIRNIIDSFDVVHFGGAYRFSDTVSLGLTSAVVNVNWTNAASQWALEDTNLRLKWTFLQGSHWGVGVQPFAVLPTGNGPDYLSDGGGVGLGALLSLAFEVDDLSFTAGGGYRWAFSGVDQSYSSLDYTQRAITEVGGGYRFAEHWILLGEFKREWPTAISGAVNPNNLFIGPRYAISKSLGGFAGMAFGNPIQDADSNDYRVLVGLKYSPQPDPPKPPPEKVLVKKCVRQDVTPKPVVYTVRFAHNEAVSLSNDLLAQITKSVKDLGSKFSRVAVVGHTSLVGTAQYNKALSYRRADAIKNFIVKSGMKPSEVWADGRGLEEPLVSPEKSEIDEALNRRVEIRIEYKQEFKTVCEEGVE